jgi:hypothetical protein
VLGLQASMVQGLPSSTTGAALATQAPFALHVSLPLQALPSVQELPAATGAWCTPVVASHVSVVQGLPSSTAKAVPAVQVPLVQTSLPLQTFASAQEVPLATATCVTPCTGSHASEVHGLPSSSTGALPATHAPAWHFSLPLQTLASAQDVPLARAA